MQLSDVWLPEGYDLNQARPLDLTDPIEAIAFRERLRDVDPNRLDMIRTLPGARDIDADRFVIVYKHESGFVSFFVIADPNGDDCVPDERHWDRLMAYDEARNPGKLLAKFREQRELVAAQARVARENQREQFRDRLNDAAKHLFDSQVPVSGAHKDRIAGKGPGLDTRTDRAAKRNRKEWS